MSLHQRLLDAIEHYEGAMGTRTLVAALRAVVELHAPVEDGFAARRWIDCRGCDSQGEPADWPCSTVRAIAREFGIEP